VPDKSHCWRAASPAVTVCANASADNEIKTGENSSLKIYRDKSIIIVEARPD